MIKNKVDYKLINLALIAFIAYILYKTSNLWLGVVGKVFSVLSPLFIAFILAYVLHPYFKYLQSKNISKGFSLAIVIATVFAILAIIIGIAAPVLFSQVSSLFNGIIAFIKEMSVKFDLT